MFHSIDGRALFFGILSIVVLVLAGIGACIYNRCVSRAKRLFTAWQMFTVGAFLSVVIQYLPIMHTVNAVADLTHRRITTVARSVFEALRVFALDGDVERIRNGLANVANGELQQAYAIFSVLTLVLAPIVTAGAVLSFFRGVTARIRYALSFTKPLFVLSKLNPQSVALARSIRQEKKGKATIVFADVFADDGEDGFELLCEAQERDVGAICLKQDITHLRFGCGFWRRVTCFVIGDDESENLAQAITLTQRLKTRRHTAIYVYATSTGSGYVLDSMEKGDLLVPTSLEKRLARELRVTEKTSTDAKELDIQDQGEFADKLMDLFEGGVYGKRLYPLADGFSVTRIDTVYNIVLDALCKPDVFHLCNQVCGDNEKVISLLIVGMGKYGKQLLKTALWYYQMEGYRLEINVIDSGKDKNGVKRDIEQVLRHECPEIMDNNGKYIDGDAQYDIQFFKNIDCFSYSLDEVFENHKERLARTLLAFVALGDDDKNIEASIALRKLFDRLYKKTNADYKGLRGLRETDAKAAEKADLPRICAVVYDDRKAQNFNINKDIEDDSFLVDYKETPYHIHCIGNLSACYSYSALLKAEETEWKAFLYHTQWVSIERTIRRYLPYQVNKDLCLQVLAQEGALSTAQPMETVENTFAEEELKELFKKVNWDDRFVWKQTRAEQCAYLLGEISKYMQFEYYRFSSVAKAVHKDLIDNALFKEKTQCTGEKISVQDKPATKNPLCRCDGCEYRRKVEHMRWNAYMRVNGYRYREQRADRALIHDCLVPAEKLSWRTRFKD